MATIGCSLSLQAWRNLIFWQLVVATAFPSRSGKFSGPLIAVLLSGARANRTSVCRLTCGAWVSCATSSCTGSRPSRLQGTQRRTGGYCRCAARGMRLYIASSLTKKVSVTVSCVAQRGASCSIETRFESKSLYVLHIIADVSLKPIYSCYISPCKLTSVSSQCTGGP